jgi:E3 ubiquitin-protein ligase SHPRH
LAEKDATRLIDDIKAAMADHEAKGTKLKEETAALREAREEAMDLEQQSQEPIEPEDLQKGKGKAREGTPSPPSSVGLDSEDLDLPRTAAGEEHAIKRRALQHRLRECYVTLHRVKFLQGDIYHVLGETHGMEEDEAYASAEQMRRNLLKSTLVFLTPS